ncbi:MAG TPA: glycerate kinase [Burkholderiaceae bacterium]
MTDTARQLLTDSYFAAVAAADPAAIVAAHLPSPPAGRTLIVGAGKAAASMAHAVEAHWPPDASLSGLVVTRYGHAMPTARIAVIEAGHPYPDSAGQQAAEEMLAAVRMLTPRDRLLALMSGGGSSLLPLPVANVTLEELRLVTKDLLRSGAAITDINIVRKHLSRIQGGRLAAACQAPITTLIISDVTGDDPSAIASGPTCFDASTYQGALDVLERHGIAPPPGVLAHLRMGAQGAVEETPKPGDHAFAAAETRVIATARDSLAAAATYFQARGIQPIVLGDTVTGEASEVAKVYAALVREIRHHGQPFKPPVVLLSGGECTVTVRGDGRGGRNAEFLLSLAIALNGMDGVYALAADTDGIDGTEDNAGALLTPDTPARALAAGLDGTRLLANNDAYRYFSTLGDLLITGPTRTNVNDYRAILIL